MAQSAFRLTGQRELRVTLARTQEVIRAISRSETERLAYEVLKGSQARAPEKTGQLVDSHRVEMSDGGDEVKADIKVGPVYHNGNEYSVGMHEGINGEEYNLGPGSEAKNDGEPHHGVGVGMKFLERAFRSVSSKALGQIRDRLARGLNGLGRLK